MFSSPDQRRQDGNAKTRLRQSCSEPEEERSLLGFEDQEKAMAIADGVEACKILSDRIRSFPHTKAKILRERETHDNTKDITKQGGPPKGHPPQKIIENGECPFAAVSRLSEKHTAKVESSVIQRPDSLPTPPPTQEHFVDSTYGKAINRHDSPPPSISGSISKCPIRMLDDRSPEEIAEFFENHKHEIPRSHEVCVRRYQSNSQTIRELDAKYGNLANMIKGLGVKHQPLLPNQEQDEDDDAAMDTRSMQKVESWAQNVDVESGDTNTPNDTKTHLSESHNRRGHFDRPLKEIRVGESPSRPWGISVPAAIPPLKLGETASTPTPNDVQTKVRDAHVGNWPNGQGQATGERGDDKPRMLFTGPVFIGYGPEQAVALSKECGSDPPGAKK